VPEHVPAPSSACSLLTISTGLGGRFIKVDHQWNVKNKCRWLRRAGVKHPSQRLALLESLWDKTDIKGPYFSLTSVTLMIARQLKGEIHSRAFRSEHEAFYELTDRHSAKPRWVGWLSLQHNSAV
jgi:hypothetical protein